LYNCILVYNALFMYYCNPWNRIWLLYYYTFLKLYFHTFKLNETATNTEDIMIYDYIKKKKMLITSYTHYDHLLGIAV